VGGCPVLVGFAVETEGGDALVSSARRKLAEKRVDLVVANRASESFGLEDNVATLVARDDVQPLTAMSKRSLADLLLDRVKALRGTG
jgi:phosphopantothenoylcysteine decarboxylase / phosphopantothenate---cysteine ligase